MNLLLLLTLFIKLRNNFYIFLYYNLILFKINLYLFIIIFKINQQN